LPTGRFRTFKGGFFYRTDSGWQLEPATKTPCPVALVLAVLICGEGASTQTSGLTRRVGNTSLAMPPSPPQFGYTLSDAFPGLSLSGPVCLTSAPDETNRLFILEQGENIVVITNLSVPTRTVFMNLPVMSDSESGLLGLAFHPGFATNGFCMENRPTLVFLLRKHRKC
jgi:hypothetical protein